MLALDLSNSFYLIDTKLAEVTLINDTASVITDAGTYCEVLKCLNNY